MDLYSENSGSGVESELIDLGAVSMTVLRTLDDATFQQALQRVLQHAAHPRVAAGGGTGDGERID
ncbi:MAG: hypothetical protein ACRDTH_15960 [Pseudonocardiaceae bacterium]